MATTTTTPPENGCHATEVTLRVEGHRENGVPSPATTTLDEDLQLFDLENASSSSPISQIEIETGDSSGNKLPNDNATMLAFTCPAVVSPATTNVAVLGALSIVSSL